MDGDLASLLYISPASDRAMNTYIYPITDASVPTDPAAPPADRPRSAELCNGNAAPKTLYEDVGRTTTFTNCDVFYLEFVPSVGWVCAYASDTPSVHIPTPGKALYFVK